MHKLIDACHSQGPKRLNYANDNVSFLASHPSLTTRIYEEKFALSKLNSISR